MRECRKCGVVQELSEYYLNRGKPTWSCKDCVRKAAKERLVRIAADLPELQRGYDLKRRYGITPREYQELLDAQGGTCAICAGPPGGHGSHLHIDHCHDTGKVRGLLCDRCNRGLGYLGDDPKVVLRAAEYVAAAGHQ